MPLLVLSAAAGLDAGSVAVLNSALPAMGAELGATPQDLSWAVTGYALAFAGLLLCGGAMADRFPRRRVLTAGLTVLMAGGALALVAGDFWLVAVGRVVQGAGAAITMPAATALLADVYPSGRQHARALGVFASAQAGSYGLGLVLGGVLTSVAGWRWVFVVQILAAVLTALAGIRRLPAGSSDRTRRLDLVGSSALVAMMALLILSADLAARPGNGLLAAAVGAGALLAGCVWWLRARGRADGTALLDPALLRFGTVRLAALAAVAFYFCVSGSLFFLPLYLQGVQGMSAAASGLGVLPVSLAVAGTALVSGRLLPRFGPRPLLVVGMAATGGGVLLWCLTGTHTSYWWPVLAGLIATGIGQGLAFPAITSSGLGQVTVAAHGTASAVTVTALQIGSGVGPAVLAGIAAAVGPERVLTGHHLAYAVAAGVVIVFGLLAAQPWLWHRN
ncbi:MFS transporter [Nonomuraea terrae]|uniref:MFS transporter n=1 Tax=Nonomuraea terrae TaxID=2530383 RepID=UPI00379D44B5